MTGSPLCMMAVSLARRQHHRGLPRTASSTRSALQHGWRSAARGPAARVLGLGRPVAPIRRPGGGARETMLEGPWSDQALRPRYQASASWVSSSWRSSSSRHRRRNAPSCPPRHPPPSCCWQSPGPARQGRLGKAGCRVLFRRAVSRMSLAPIRPSDRAIPAAPDRVSSEVPSDDPRVKRHPACVSRGGSWSGRRDSNPRHSAWEADTLPTELLPPGRARS